MPRVISGSAKRVPLKSPKGFDTRPTTDRAKEGLFNILSNNITEDTNILDVFSGIGSLGIEALSRGANHGYFIDSNGMSVKIIQDNLEKTKLIQKATILKMDFKRALKLIHQRKKSFDLIFMDPPYQRNLIVPCIEKIVSYDIITENGLLIVEHEKTEKMPDLIERLQKTDTRLYGITGFSFYKIRR